MAIPTATQIRDELEGYGISTTVLTDAWIERCRDEEILPHVKEVTKLNFDAEQSLTEPYNGTGSSVLILNRRPVSSVTNIRYTASEPGVNLISVVELFGSEGIIKIKTQYSEGIYGPVFSRGEKNILVTYTYGFTDYPTDVARAIKLMVGAKMLALIGARTGGGSLTVQSHGRSYGSHGKYTDIRKELVASAYSLLRKYTTSVVGG